ncbi:MAG: NADH oxidase [Cytophagia bacterium]|jgi:adenylyltransferase/sulfurtransferase|nr:NADH oxidase [Cytophagia bacterium]|tara:strand:- start:215 stop:535 length:321 start_codon:yes stop_codon:yes gene_type:complete
MKSISPKELNSFIESDNSNFQLIDIRDEYEYDICCIGGEKINMYSITDNIDKLSKNKKIIIYCRTGVRSANIVNLLEKNFSFDNVYNLDGGIMRWRDDIDQSLKSY